MQRAGHVGAALAAYAPVAFVTAGLGFDDLALLGGLAAVGLAMLPDVDLRLPLVPHRGPTHTVWFAGLAAVAGGLLGWSAGVGRGGVAAAGLAAFGGLVGGLVVGAHVAADALTPMGVRPLAPLSDRRVTYGLARASNPVANVLLLVLGAGLAVAAFALGRWVAGL
ncbi:MAG: metal-dependent hydrolase [Halobacteriales archaeon]